MKKIGMILSMLSLSTLPVWTQDIESLDLREANVTAVEWEKTSAGTYRLAVTLYHDDDGEEGYADWWQVETLDGNLLGRRKLLHSHGTREFTRSEVVEIPENVTRVIIRGHDQTHGYGGRAVVLNLETGEIRAVDQGSDKKKDSITE